jgi:hypothetical protein
MLIFVTALKRVTFDVYKKVFFQSEKFLTLLHYGLLAKLDKRYVNDREQMMMMIT